MAVRGSGATRCSHLAQVLRFKHLNQNLCYRNSSRRLKSLGRWQSGTLLPASAPLLGTSGIRSGVLFLKSVIAKYHSHTIKSTNFKGTVCPVLTKVHNHVATTLPSPQNLPLSPFGVCPSLPPTGPCCWGVCSLSLPPLEFYRNENNAHSILSFFH